MNQLLVTLLVGNNNLLVRLQLLGRWGYQGVGADTNRNSTCNSSTACSCTRRTRGVGTQTRCRGVVQVPTLGIRVPGSVQVVGC